MDSKRINELRELCGAANDIYGNSYKVASQKAIVNTHFSAALDALEAASAERDRQAAKAAKWFNRALMLDAKYYRRSRQKELTAYDWGRSEAKTEIARLTAQLAAETRRADAGAIDCEIALNQRYHPCLICAAYSTHQTCDKCQPKWRGPCADNAPDGTESEQSNGQ